MSTVAPSEHVQLASAIARAGGKLLECAVGGTVGPARTGQLLGLVGGDSEDLERARPVLERFCRRVELMGPIGAGASAKLAVNLPLIVFWQAFGEAVAMMRDVDKDPEWLVDLFNETAGAANVLKLRSAAVAATLAGSDTVPPGFDIDSMRKDVGTMVRVAREGGLRIPVAQAALLALDEAVAAGWGPRDCAWVPAFWAAKSPSAS